MSFYPAKCKSSFTDSFSEMYKGAFSAKSISLLTNAAKDCDCEDSLILKTKWWSGAPFLIGASIKKGKVTLWTLLSRLLECIVSCSYESDPTTRIPNSSACPPVTQKVSRFSGAHVPAKERLNANSHVAFDHQIVIIIIKIVFGWEILDFRGNFGFSGKFRIFGEISDFRGNFRF